MVSNQCHRLWRRFWLVILAMGIATHALAHDPGLSGVTARLRGATIELTFAFSIKDACLLAPLDGDHDGTLTASEFDAAGLTFTSVVTNGFHLQLDGEPVAPNSALAWFEAGSDAYCLLVFPFRACSNLTIQSTLFDQLPPGHRQFFTLAAEDGTSLGERLLSQDQNRASFAMNGTASAAESTIAPHNSFANFLVLGVEHILTGYDHLLFLFGLLIVTSRVGPALKIITCFTLAHSITLAVATLSWIQIPSRIVEPLIAASIVYVGLENLFREDANKGRWMLTFGFGLVHGFGFASVLRELGVGANGSGIALPLVSFNLGVELGQIMVAAIALPIIWKLRTTPVFVKSWVPACSVLVTLAGGYWFVERVWF